MSIHIRFTPKQEAIWANFVASRPAVVREAIAKYRLRPDVLYRLKTTDQRVVLHSIDEGETITVQVDVLDEMTLACKRLKVEVTEAAAPQR